MTLLRFRHAYTGDRTLPWEYNVLVTMPDGKEEKYFHKHSGREKLVKREAFLLEADATSP